MQEKKGGNEIVFRPTELVTARYSLPNKNANDFLDVLLGIITSDSDEDRLDYSVYAKGITTYYGLKTDRKHIYEYLKDAANYFVIKGKGDFDYVLALRIVQPNGKLKRIQCFQEIEYIEGAGRVDVVLTSDFKKMIVDATRGVFYKAEIPIQMKHIWAKRMYYYLADYAHYQNKFKGTMGEVTVTLNELTDMLSCSPYLCTYSRFKEKVLEVAKKEINESSNIEFEYEEITGNSSKGRPKVEALKFKVREKENFGTVITEKEPSPVLEEEQKFADKIHIALGCTQEMARSVARDAISAGLSSENLTEILSYEGLENALNKVAYVKSLIKNGFSKEVLNPQKAKNKFTNFSGHGYSKSEISELERQLLQKQMKG